MYTTMVEGNYNIETEAMPMSMVSAGGSCEGCRYDPTYEQLRDITQPICNCKVECIDYDQFSGRDSICGAANKKYQKISAAKAKK